MFVVLEAHPPMKPIRPFLVFKAYGDSTSLGAPSYIDILASATAPISEPASWVCDIKVAHDVENHVEDHDGLLFCFCQIVLPIQFE